LLLQKKQVVQFPIDQRLCSDIEKNSKVHEQKKHDLQARIVLNVVADTQEEKAPGCEHHNVTRVKPGIVL
jgi:hypothetical protein